MQFLVHTTPPGTQCNRLRDSRIEDRLTPLNDRIIISSCFSYFLFPPSFFVSFLNGGIFDREKWDWLLYKLVKPDRRRGSSFPWEEEGSVIRCTSRNERAACNNSVIPLHLSPSRKNFSNSPFLLLVLPPFLSRKNF